MLALEGDHRGEREENRCAGSPASSRTWLATICGTGTRFVLRSQITMSLILALGPRGLTLHTPPVHVPVPAVHTLSTRAPQQFAVDAAHAAIFPTTDVLAAKSSKYDDILNSNTVNIDLGDILGVRPASLAEPIASRTAMALRRSGQRPRHITLF